MNEEIINDNGEQIISPVTIGCMIAAFLEDDKEKGISYANFIADKYHEAGMERSERIIRKRIDGTYKNEPKVVLD